MNRMVKFLRQLAIRFIQWLDAREYDKYARHLGYKNWKEYAKKRWLKEVKS